MPFPSFRLVDFISDLYSQRVVVVKLLKLQWSTAALCVPSEAISLNISQIGNKRAKLEK